MTYNTVGDYIKESKGINNIELVDTQGNTIGNSYDLGITHYLDRCVMSESVEDKGNCGIVATLVI